MILPFSKTVERGRNLSCSVAKHKAGDPFGNFLFELRGEGGKRALAVVVASSAAPEHEMKWDHVSVHMRYQVQRGRKMVTRMRTPTWGEMCHIKDLFFAPDEEVIQFHPKKEDYVNLYEHILHLWKPQGDLVLPTPPLVAV